MSSSSAGEGTSSSSDAASDDGSGLESGADSAGPEDTSPVRSGESASTSSTTSTSSSEPEAQPKEKQSQCSHSPESDATSSSESDAAKKPAVLAKPLGAQLETTEAHVERHCFPAHVRDCERRRYVRNRSQWEEDATYVDPRSGLKQVWLVEQPRPLQKPWHLGCAICMQANIGGRFGRCKGGAKLSNIRRHGESAGHRAALAQLHLSSDRLGASPDLVGEGLTAAHVLFQRELIAHGGSFESFSRFCKTAKFAGADLGFGSVGPKISKQLTAVLADMETMITGALLRNTSVLGFMQDALGSHVACRLRMVVWKLPRCVEAALDGLLPRGVLALGPRGPWCVDRLACLASLGSDHGAGAKKAIMRECLAKVSPDPATFKLASKVLRFYASDACPTEVRAAELSQMEDFPNLKFHSADASHGSLVALKTAFRSDPEVALVDELLISGKKPPSLAKLLRTSSKMQSFFKEAELSEAVAVLSHFGFAPQRFDSRKVPLGRIATRLRQAFAALAEEAEHCGEETRRNGATHLLNELTGEKSMRLVLGAMMADLAHEHSKHSTQATRTNAIP